MDELDQKIKENIEQVRTGKKEVDLNTDK